MHADQQFDVVYDDPLEPLLIAACGELAAAETVMKRLALAIPGKYFVWSSGEGKVLARLDTFPRTAYIATQSVFAKWQTLARAKNLRRYNEKEYS